MSLTNIEKNITLDVYDHDTTPSVIKAIQMDKGTRTVYAGIQNSRQDYDIGQNASVSLTVLRPDKTRVQIVGETFISHTGTDGTMYGAKAYLSDVALAVKGNLKAQFKITSGEQELRTEIFTINTGEALDAGDGDWAGDLDGHNLDEMAESIETLQTDMTTVNNDVSELKEGFTQMQTATAEDVGKALKAKTVTDGKVTEWEFGETGVAVDPTLTIEGRAADAKAVGDRLKDVEGAVTSPPEIVDAILVTNTNIAENGDKWYAINGYSVQYSQVYANKKVTFTITPNRTGDFRFGFSTAAPMNTVPATYLGKLSLTGTTPSQFEYTPAENGYVGFGYYNNLLNALSVEIEGDTLANEVADLKEQIEHFDVETDKTLTVSDKAADAKVTGGRIEACEEWIHGDVLTETPTMLNNINLAVDAVMYNAVNGYVTYYIPVGAFEKWTYNVTANRSGDVRIGFATSIPAHRSAATYLDKITLSARGETGAYAYIPTEDGYLTASYYASSNPIISAITASGLSGGAEKDIKDNAADIDFLESIVAPIYTSADFRRTQTHHETLRLVKNAQSSYKNQSSPLTLIHFSDIHGDAAALARIKADVADLGYNDIICTGDMVATTNSEIVSWWDADVLTCIGNHDAATNNGGWVYDALPMSDRDAYYIAPFENGWGIVHTSGTSYYYKDYATQKVRLIVLDAQLYLSDNTDATAQTAWLTNLLADAKTNNLHVIIAIHGAAEIAPYVDCSFTKAGATHTGYDEMSNTPQAVVDAVESAISGGMKFVCYIVGHVHQDGVFKPTNSQLGFEVTCANSANIAQWYYSDQYRSDTEDAYNVVVVDTKNTLIRVIRGGGADVDNLMRTRKGICFNYSTGAKVGEIL